jgi:hypothetical protein
MFLEAPAKFASVKIVSLPALREIFTDPFCENVFGRRIELVLLQNTQGESILVTHETI